MSRFSYTPFTKRSLECGRDVQLQIFNQRNNGAAGFANRAGQNKRLEIIVHKVCDIFAGRVGYSMKHLAVQKGTEGCLKVSRQLS